MHKGYMHTHKKYLNGHIITTYFLRNYDYRFFCFSSQLSNFLPKKMEKMNNTHTQEQNKFQIDQESKGKK